MSTMPTTFLRSLAAWKRPRQRDRLQELLQAKKNSEENGLNQVKVTLEPGEDVCQMRESPFLLIKLAARGDEAEIERLCTADTTRVQIEDSKGWNAVHHAAANNKPMSIILLYNHGADINWQDNLGRTPLHTAVEKEAVEAIDTLIHCCDVEMIDNDGFAPFHLAVILNKLRSLEALLQHLDKVDLHQGDTQGRTALHLAAKFDFQPSAQMLLDSYAAEKVCPNKACLNGYSPIHIAARNASVNVLEALLKWGEARGCMREKMICLPDLEGNEPLHLAVHGGEIKAVELCVKMGAIISKQQDDKSTPVHLACSQGSIDIVKLMFSLQPQEKFKVLETLDAQGMRPLHCAAMFDHPDLVTYLLQEGGSVDQVDQEHRTALLLSASHGGWRTADVLLDHGADPTIRDMNAKNLLHIVIMSGGSLTDLLSLKQASNAWIKYSFYPLQMSHEQIEAERIRLKDPKMKPPPLYACNEMVVCGRLELLKHPLTQRYLDMKWQAYGKAVHLFNLFTYLVYLSLVTIFAVGVLGNNSSLALGNVTKLRTNQEMLIDSLHISSESIIEPTGWMSLMAVAIVAFAVLNMMKELFQIYHHRLKYLLTAINVVQWTMYLTSVCMVGPVFMGHEWGAQQFNSAAMAVFTAWFSLLLYIQKFDHIGIYIVMFLEILNTLLKVLFVFSILIVAFGLAFYILMSHGGYLSFSSVPMSMLHTFSMMLGEIDFLNMFVYPFYDQSPRGDVLQFPRTTFVLLVVFMILMPILLMNLLIGLAVGDIESVRKNAQLKMIAMQVEMHSDLESKLPEVILRQVNKSELVIYPNHCKCRRIITRLLGGILDTSPESKNSLIGELDTLDAQKEDYLWEELEGQQRRLRGISHALEKQTGLLQLIMQKMEIQSEAEYDEGVCFEDLQKAPPKKLRSPSATSRQLMRTKKD